MGLSSQLPTPVIRRPSFSIFWLLSPFLTSFLVFPGLNSQIDYLLLNHYFWSALGKPKLKTFGIESAGLVFDSMLVQLLGI